MLWFWPTVVKRMVEAAEPRIVLQIGAARGHNTRNLLEHARSRDCVVHVIDPELGFDADAYQTEFGEALVLHPSKSHDALPETPVADVVLIDGDHNWYTVHHELQLLEAGARSDGRRFPVVLLSNVSWPYARRDMYSTPEDVPEEYRQPHRQANIVLGEPGLNTEKGINGGLFNAEVEGTPRNGVLTAVEDFVEASELPFEFRSVRGFAGLGVLISADVLADNEQLRHEFDRLHESEFLLEHTKRMERLAISSQMAAAHAKRQLRRAELRLKELERNPAVKEQAGSSTQTASAVATSSADESGVPDPAGDRERGERVKHGARVTDPAPETMDALALRHGTDKGSQRHNFARVYDSFLSPWRDRPVKVLELGVYQGASLRMWRDYFAEGQIYGVDIKAQAVEHAGERIKVFIGDQKDPQVLDQVLADSGPLDLVVDDGSHRLPEQRGSMLHLWPHVKPGGSYVVEDIHTSYLEGWGMAYRQKDSTVEFLKDVVDDIHAGTHKVPPKLGQVASVHFYMEVCVICKKA